MSKSIIRESQVERKKRKRKIGVVVSASMNKSIVVEVRRSRSVHGVYGKPVLKTSRFMAHDEENDCIVGDKVIVMETRPLSRHKNWLVVKKY